MQPYYVILHTGFYFPMDQSSKYRAFWKDRPNFKSVYFTTATCHCYAIVYKTFNEAYNSNHLKCYAPPFQMVRVLLVYMVYMVCNCWDIVISNLIHHFETPVYINGYSYLSLYTYICTFCSNATGKRKYFNFWEREQNILIYQNFTAFGPSFKILLELKKYHFGFVTLCLPLNCTGRITGFYVNAINNMWLKYSF